MGLALLAVFWIAIALVLLLAPDDVLPTARPATRRYGAIGALIFAASCVVALLVT
jgi:hypothetical protein